MSTARVKATATTMLDGHVLVVGGNDGTNDLASAEIFDAASGSFFATGAMQTARSGHVAVLLPDNNQVLIAGGTQAGGGGRVSGTLRGLERRLLADAESDVTARAGGIAGGLVRTTWPLSAEAAPRPASLRLRDREDRSRGLLAGRNGDGHWLRMAAGRNGDDRHFRGRRHPLRLHLQRGRRRLRRITNAEFAPIENEVFHHFGKKFYVAARGAASRR